MPLTQPRPGPDQVLPDIYVTASNSIQTSDVATSGAYDPTHTAIRVENLSQLVPEVYDSISLTYWTSGNGNGQIETVQYYTGGLSGTLVATLTLNYDSSARISTVART